MYENDETLGAERDLAARMGRVLNAELVKLPRSYRLDYGLIRTGRLAGFVELKCRTHESTTYPSLILSAGKWLEACQWLELGYPCNLVARFNDGDFIHDLAPFGYEITMGGRVDRNDPADVEPVIHVPVSMMRRIPDAV